MPGDMDGLTRLRGVGRKTASIVLGNAFAVPAVAVDRHVYRVSDRLRLGGKDETKTEDAVKSLYPPKDWVKATWCLVLHGRRVCRPTPMCWVCPVIELCPYPKKTKDPAARSIRRTTPRAASRGRER